MRRKKTDNDGSSSEQRGDKEASRGQNDAVTLRRPDVGGRHQVVFLTEIAVTGTKYVNAFKDAVAAAADDDPLSTVVVVNQSTVFGDVSAASTAQRSVAAALRNVLDAAADRMVVLINFFDVQTVVEVLRGHAAALVRLECGAICQVRDEFAPNAVARDREAAMLRFWHELDAASSAAVFKHLIVYPFRSTYNVRVEPPDLDAIVHRCRAHVACEMAAVLDAVHAVRAAYEQYVTHDPVVVYSLRAAVTESPVPLYKLYAARLAGRPASTVTVAVIVDALVHAIQDATTPLPPEWEDVYVARLRDDDRDRHSDDRAPCAQYGDECNLVARKLSLCDTDFARPVVDVLNARWQRTVWGSRPCRPAVVQTAYDATIAAIERRCKNTDLRLCALALNLLRGHLDEYRGQTVRLRTLLQTVTTDAAAFKPEFVESLSRAAMLQTLEKQSERYARVGYAYFEPEDVMLVGFYDFPQDGPSTRKRQFDFVVPQRPVYARDYFDYIYGKKKPDCVYAMDAPLWSTYTEQTEDVRLGNGDRLTVSRRKWKYEPETVSLLYQSKSYEIVRHMTVDGYDNGFRIYTDRGEQFHVDKVRGRVEVELRTVDGTEIVCHPDDFTQRSATVGESYRRYGNGCVVVGLADDVTVTYWSSGRVETMQPKRSGSSVVSSGTGRPRGAVAGPKKPNAIQRSSTNSEIIIRSKSTRQRGSSKGSVEMTSNEILGNVTAKEAYRAAIRYEYSRDGTIAVVWFADGTEIATHVCEVSPDARLPDWTRFEVAERQYRHPAYRTVTETASGNLGVPGLVQRFPDDGRCRMLWRSESHDRIEAAGHGVDVRYVDNETPSATFRWAGEHVLFETRDGRTAVRRHETAVALSDGYRPLPPDSTLFVVKRDMSGFAMVERVGYEEFTRDVSGGRGAVTHECGRRIVTVFGPRDEAAADESRAERGRRYVWFGIHDRKQQEPTIPKPLTCRTLNKLDADHGAVMDALREVMASSSSLPPPPERIAPQLVVNVNAPTADEVRAMYERGSDWRVDLYAAAPFVRSMVRGAIDLVVKRTRRAIVHRHALEAWRRINDNSFIPYFQSDRYEPLRKRLLAVNSASY